MNKLSFNVDGKIQGKARPFFFKSKNGKTGAFTRENTRNYEQFIALKAKQAMIKANINRIDDEPLKVNIYAYFKIPEYFTKKQREQAELGILRPTKKPDIDNIAKIYLDAFNGVVWKDDKQVVILTCAKIYLINPEIEENVDVLIEKM